jgi:hypothetical protein
MDGRLIFWQLTSILMLHANSVPVGKSIIMHVSVKDQTVESGWEKSANKNRWNGREAYYTCLQSSFTERVIQNHERSGVRKRKSKRGAKLIPQRHQYEHR